MRLADSYFAHYIGRDYNEVFRAIQAGDMYETIVTVQDQQMVTMDFNPNRCRIWYNPKTNLVTDVSIG